MKSKIFLFLITIILFNCNTEKKPQLTYKYTTDAPILECEGMDTKLFEEALLSFEADLINTYTPDQATPARAYSQFIRAAVSNRVKYNEMVSQHSQEVYEALKADENLWKTTQDNEELNFNHPIFECIGKAIKNDNFKTTYNALVSTNSMSMRMIGNELQRNTYTFKDDKYAATFAALITYYGNFHKIDFSQPKTEKSDEKNKAGKLEKPTRDDHEGHNH